MKPISVSTLAAVLTGLLTLGGCTELRTSTTPALDQRFGVALQEAKRAQSLPPTPPVASEAAAAGAGQPTATEVNIGLQAQQRGRPVPPAFDSAR